MEKMIRMHAVPVTGQDKSAKTDHISELETCKFNKCNMYCKEMPTTRDGIWKIRVHKKWHASRFGSIRH
jgi:hypothetical protein